jgi:DNA-binding transcriptional regulator YdaS (Cro superfamily)
MDELRAFLNSMSTDQQFAFARRCNTTIGYLRKCLSVGTIGYELAVTIDRESFGQVPVERLRPDVDIAHLRNRRRRPAAA